ncbi:MAG: fructose-1,6-bisphosphatase [Candidatus Cyclonatronum sp.]|uniref:fructose-1,6-bisphosphatase n=1 Tax=Cyclonatronum sp. TaxID=3024185 RepID=UPI0025C376B5|nr:fructose-1,6-bisphosphatase [Cyclonatronum sp.]MCC5932715.1 fructose-1,6-bisphosphatase [Balneolales bacterium]MCH8485687.1 fructose-1,6-bisphosphatase [Cyclonatronum sp.]
MYLAEEEMRFLRLLAQQYPSIRAASTEIINLSAIMELPKGTEHFLSDIHGENEAFLHVLRNGSGSIKRRITEIFDGVLSLQEQQQLATLIYYPEQKMPLILKDIPKDRQGEWYSDTLFRLIKMCRVYSSKYTRNRVRKALPKDFAYIIEELLHQQESISNRQEYYTKIINSIIDTGRGGPFIVALCYLIQRLTIARLHVIGDVYDRGPGAHIIMDKLLEHHSVDFQWGNHDIVWMGAAAGSEACICNVIRVSLRYANMETLENGYAISMLPLISLAVDLYGNDPCTQFMPKECSDFNSHEQMLMARMHKAITVIQLKLEGQIVQRRPQYGMKDRLMLDKINFDDGTIDIGEKTYSLVDANLPTINPDDPYALSEDEAIVMEKLVLSFKNSERLQAHTRFLFSKGSMYLTFNGNLLYHGCIPMTKDGKLAHFTFEGVDHGPRAFMDRLERLARQGYFAKDDPEQKLYGMDSMWYLWSGPQSPLFGKDKMATFERYFIAEKETHTEHKNPYYHYRTEEPVAKAILKEFGMNPEKGHILNGHVPVKVKTGEDPIKAGGKLLVIDGGFAKAYQNQTGIAGYTLIFNSYGLLLAAHQPFESTQKAIEQGDDIHSHTKIVEHNKDRIRVKDTDDGRKIQQTIDDLKMLLDAYRTGAIKEME